MLLGLLIWTEIRAQKTTLFKWDVSDLENVFCESSKNTFIESEAQFWRKEDASQFLKSSKAPKAARRKLAIWPWEFQDKFEGECIEETCKSDEIAEFCSRKKSNIDDPEKNKKLNTRREERYNFCRKHVDKLVDNIKTTAKKKEGELESWQKELTPERLFRGWWEELKKAYLRFCLKDSTDCARQCNIDHGLCRLSEDPLALNTTDRWHYRCVCDPGWGPFFTKRTDNQYMCSKEIDNEDDSLCSPLGTIEDDSENRLKRDNDQKNTVPIDHKYLCDKLEEGWDCSRDNRRRKKRVAGKPSDFARFAFFPAAVEIMYSPKCNLARNDDNCAGKGSKKDSGELVRHQCGGTLLNLAQAGFEEELKGRTNVVVTAAHCFCGLNWDKNLPKAQSNHYVAPKCDSESNTDCRRKPKPGHWFVRIGLINNQEKLNLKKARKQQDNAFYQVDVGENYIDVQVRQIDTEDDYLTASNCNTPAHNGKNDLAVLFLDGHIDVGRSGASKGLQYHVKPACNIADSHGDFRGEDAAMFIGNNRCFAAGWGKTVNKKGADLALSDDLRFINVEIVDPMECVDGIQGDQFIGETDPSGKYINVDRIICAKGHDTANTCEGDSGGGLYCFDKSGSNFYFMGPLHGGSDNCQGDNLMYFTNMAYDKHRDWLQQMLQNS